MNTILDTIKKWREVLVLAGFFLTIGGFFVKPYAETFVQQSVDARFKDVSAQIASIQKTIDDNKLQGVRTESDLTSLKALLKQLLDLQLTEARRNP